MSNITELLNIPAILPVKTTYDTRTLWDIVRGCLATLFACLWVSVHPNMPSYTHSDIRVFFTKVELMIWTLFFSEMIILWAFRQWLGARTLSRKFKDYGWSMGHGFLLQMGGFVNTSPEGHIRVLLPHDLFKWIIQQERVPKVTVQQISGRSKGDGFSKAMVIIQTSWFVAQCIGRCVKDLYITPAELSTLTFAALNAVMYSLWWHKPLDCRTPVELHPGYPGYPYAHIRTCSLASASSVLIFSPDTESRIHPAEMANEDTAPQEIVSQETVPEVERTIFSNAPASSQISEASVETDYSNERIQLRRILLYPYKRLAQMRTGTSTRYDSWSQVPVFYAYTDRGSGIYKALREDTFFGHILLMVVCLIFGSIHLLAWFSDFPRHIEHLLWKICSVAITVLPPIYVVPILLLRPTLANSGRELISPNNNLQKRLLKLIVFVQLAIPPFYFIARLFLLIEMIISLRNLPSSAFMAVTWTAYFPHV